MKNIIFYGLLLGTLGLASAYIFSSMGNVDSSLKIEGWSCLDTFDDFLFQMTEIPRSDPRYKLSGIYPTNPWEFVRELPKSYAEIKLSERFEAKIEISRSYMKQTELWIRNGDQNIFRYIPATEHIFLLSPHPSDNDGTVFESVIVKDIFEMEDGSIFGINYPQNNDTVWREAIPLLSVFNELSGKFEFDDIGLSYRAENIRPDWVGMIPRDGVTVANDGKTIWIYQQQEGLFNYDPVNSELYHHDIHFSGIVQRMIISPEGNLLFRQEKEGANWELTPGELLQYNPVFSTHQEIKVPFLRWPDYGTLLYTNSGDLWIGIHGYLSIDEDWVLKNPRRRAFINLGRASETYNWVHPRLLLQSSNGFLWYTSYSGDSLGVHGTAWFDPISDSGCWFTTEPGIIVEDSQQTLWMLIDRKLYKYKLAD